MSAVIRALKADGGIILTASHNPGGPDGDFGVKYNCSNGGPAPDNITNEIYLRTQVIQEYKILELSPPAIDLRTLGEQKLKILENDEMTIEIIDSVEIYLELLKSIFDFDRLGHFVSSKRLLIDAMNGVMGPYVKRIIVQELGASPDTAIRCQPMEDFGGYHPDPNLTYAAELVRQMKTGEYDFGAAFDGDGDRNMILGKNGFFVTPSDSLAILADNLELIPYFTGKVKGYARSMPTSMAVDNVAIKKGYRCYETPTGWKYFGTLLDADLVSLCGEESFGTGSNHIREKDGLWAVLAWLSIMESLKKGVESIVKDHWQKYGRCYYSRYDYENCESKACLDMMASLEEKLLNNQLQVNIQLSNEQANQLEKGFNFEYTDLITGEVASKQGLVLLLNNGHSRIIFRLSGTGSSGATIRLYLEHCEMDREKAVNGILEHYIKPLAEVALKISNLPEFIGREKPTVIT